MLNYLINQSLSQTSKSFKISVSLQTILRQFRDKFLPFNTLGSQYLVKLSLMKFLKREIFTRFFHTAFSPNFPIWFSSVVDSIIKFLSVDNVGSSTMNINIVLAQKCDFPIFYNSLVAKNYCIISNPFFMDFLFDFSFVNLKTWDHIEII